MKITYIKDIDNVEHAVIENADGSFTSMLKSTYDEMIAAQNDAAEKS